MAATLFTIGVCLGDPAYSAAAGAVLRLESTGRLGGSGQEVAWASAVGADGSLYVVGQTTSSDFPTAHPLQPSYGGAGDGFVTKISPDRRSIVYSTFLGGSGSDTAVSIVVGPSGDAYVVGNTTSVNFPKGLTTNHSPGGDVDIFAVRISPDGSQIVYSTVIGGSRVDGAEAVSLDTQNAAVLIGGSSSSSDFPLFPPGSGTLGGDSDGLLLRLNAASGRVELASYFGGSGSEDIRALVSDSSGTYIAGNTTSADLPAAANAFHGALDVFVSRLGPTMEVHRTLYLGGSAEDQVSPGALALTSAGDLIVSAATRSPDYPDVDSLFSYAGNNRYDAAVTVIGAQDLDIKFSTLLGGKDDDFGSAVATFGASICVVGSTASTDFPLHCAEQKVHGTDRYEMFVTCLESGRLKYSSFAGRGIGQGLAVGGQARMVAFGNGLGLESHTVEPWPISTETATDDLLFVEIGQRVNSCAGDCCGDGAVTVDDLILAVSIALGHRGSYACSAADENDDGEVSISEIIRGVGNALVGCPVSLP